MPELPEVETLCRQLNTILPGQEILAVEIRDPLLEPCESQRLTGRAIAAVHRRGKTIGLEIGGRSRLSERSERGKRRVGVAGVQWDEGFTAEMHLRMTGRLLWQAGGTALPDYTRLVIVFSAGKLLLIDPRRFATFRLKPAPVALPPLADPLEGLPARRLKEIAGMRRLPVKCLLMDQRFIAGLGNIYACELLHHAGIDPRRPSGALSVKDWRKVELAAAAILPRAVACRGTSVSDWRDLFGMRGENQAHLEVYARDGEVCRRCGGKIERATLAGRGTWFCPTCQR